MRLSAVSIGNTGTLHQIRTHPFPSTIFQFTFQYSVPQIASIPFERLPTSLKKSYVKQKIASKPNMVSLFVLQLYTITNEHRTT
jgi:hypothetical protein